MTQPGAVHTRHLAERSRNPYRLGRHVEHHPRSLAFAAPVLPKTAIRSVQWTRRVGIFDQGDLGSCTGMAAAGWVGTDNATRPGVTGVGNEALDATWAAETLYHLATTFDEFDGAYRPQDTGSSGLGAAKALASLGLCSGYTHGFSVPAMLTALQTGPVLIGIAWFNSMFDPAPSGLVTVDTASGLAGGHELCVDRFDADDDRVWFAQSWGTGWGADGRGYFTLADLAVLLADDGDCTIPTPVPVPADPAPAPATPGGCLPGFAKNLFRRR